MRTTQAVVVGAGLAGLLAARVLVDHFDEVLLLERDRLPEDATARRGATQTSAVHGILARGVEALDSLLPGVVAEAVAGGAVSYDAAADVASYQRGRWSPRFHSGVRALCCTGALLEASARRRLREHPRVRFEEGITALGLVPDARGDRLIGVRVARGEGEGEGEGQLLPAALVVLAGGRASAGPAWLRALGHAVPERQVVREHQGHVARRYALSGPWRPDWKMAVLEDGSWSVEIVPLEGDLWSIGLLNADATRALPGDDDAFTAALRGTPQRLLQEFLAAARPISPVKILRVRGSCAFRYDRLPRAPEGLVVVGDAFCSLNPDYTQGVTMAALGALTLREHLEVRPRAWVPRPGEEGLARAFHRALGQRYALPWLVATAEPWDPAGEPGPIAAATGRLFQGYVERLLAAAAVDHQLARAFLEMKHMLRAPLSLAHPALMLRVLGARV